MRDYQGMGLLYSIGSSQPRFECEVFGEATIVAGQTDYLSTDSECLTRVICFHSRTAAIDKRHLSLTKVRRLVYRWKIRCYLMCSRGIRRHRTWGIACCWIVSSHLDYSSQSAKKKNLTFSSVVRCCLDGCNVRSKIIWSIIRHAQRIHAETLWGLGHSIVLARCSTFATLILLLQWMPCCQGSLR